MKYLIIAILTLSFTVANAESQSQRTHKITSLARTIAADEQRLNKLRDKKYEEMDKADSKIVAVEEKIKYNLRKYAELTGTAVE